MQPAEDEISAFVQSLSSGVWLVQHKSDPYRKKAELLFRPGEIPADFTGLREATSFYIRLNQSLSEYVARYGKNPGVEDLIRMAMQVLLQLLQEAEGCD